MATVKELQQIATDRGIDWRKSWTKAQLEEALSHAELGGVGTGNSDHAVPDLAADESTGMAGGDQAALEEAEGRAGSFADHDLPFSGLDEDPEGDGNSGVPTFDGEEEDWAEETAEGESEEEAGAGEGVEEAEEAEEAEPGPYDLMTIAQLHEALRTRGMTHAAKSWTKEHLIRQMEALDRGEAPIKKEQEAKQESVVELLAQLKALGPKDGKAKKQIRTKLRRQGHFISKVGKA